MTDQQHSHVKRVTYVVLGIVSLGFAGLWCVIHGLGEVARTAAGLSEFESKAVDLYLDSAKTLSSYALLVLAGVGYFVQLIFSGSEKVQATLAGKLLLIGAVFLCALSLLAGYSIYSNLIDLFIYHLSFSPDMPRLYWFHQFQFWTFLAAVAFFCIFSVEALFS